VQLGRDRHALSSGSPLKAVTVVYEDRGDWILEARGRGFSRTGAEAAGHWLLGRAEIEQTFQDLREAASETEFRLVSIAEFLGDASALLRGSPTRHLLWNITDGQASFRGSHLISFAALAGIPYFGCPPYAQAIGQDKFKLFSLCRQIGVDVPSSALAENGEIVASFLEENEVGALFVKPNSGGNKVGLSGQSRCGGLSAALAHARNMAAELRDRMIVQRFIEGPEVRVTFVNADAMADEAKLGFDLIDEQAQAFITADERDSKYDAFRDFLAWDGISKDRRERIAGAMRDAILAISRHIVLKDYFTVDFRIDAEDRPYLIDFNPGAFLYGDDVEGYTQKAFGLSLPRAILTAMHNAHAGHHGRPFETGRMDFRL
jgi:D-alanine-D-alanine ligase